MLSVCEYVIGSVNMTLLWVSISIILALNSMWLLKLNKDLVERNEELIATIVIKDMNKED